MNTAMEGGRALRLKNDPPFRVRFSNRRTGFLSNFEMISREINDRPVQNKKSTATLKELMRNIPNEGARANAIWNTR